jgi:DNA-binding NarL/FixJ family response regulator
MVRSSSGLALHSRAQIASWAAQRKPLAPDHNQASARQQGADGRDVVELCRRLRPELVLMDPRMPLMDGGAATKAIEGELPDTRALVLTAVDESAGLSDSLEADAAGYFLKDAPAARITDAVRRTLAGESALDAGWP